MPRYTAEAAAAEREELAAKYRFIDRNRNGLVDRDELESVLQCVDRRLWCRDRVDRLFSVLDTKGDGVVDFDEFSGWVSTSAEDFVYTRDLQSFRIAVNHLASRSPLGGRRLSSSSPHLGGGCVASGHAPNQKSTHEKQQKHARRHNDLALIVPQRLYYRKPCQSTPTLLGSAPLRETPSRSTHTSILVRPPRSGKDGGCARAASMKMKKVLR